MVDPSGLEGIPYEDLEWDELKCLAYMREYELEGYCSDVDTGPNGSVTPHIDWFKAEKAYSEYIKFWWQNGGGPIPAVLVLPEFSNPGSFGLALRQMGYGQNRASWDQAFQVSQGNGYNICRAAGGTEADCRALSEGLGAQANFVGGVMVGTVATGVAIGATAGGAPVVAGAASRGLGPAGQVFGRPHLGGRSIITGDKFRLGWGWKGSA